MSAVFTPAIRFVYFDFDNVLATRTVRRAELVAQALGIDDSAALRAYYTQGFRADPELERQYFAVRTVDDERAFYAAVFHRFSPGDSAAAEKAARLFVAVPFAVDPNAAGALQQLSQEYTLGVLTNGLPSRRQEIEASGLAQYFQQIIISYDYAVEKPSAELYDIAIQATQMPSAQLALVDDEPANVAGASQAGFGQSILFTPAFWQTVLPAAS